MHTRAEVYVRSWPDMLGGRLVSDQDGQLTGAMYPPVAPGWIGALLSETQRGFCGGGEHA